MGRLVLAFPLLTFVAINHTPIPTTVKSFHQNNLHRKVKKMVDSVKSRDRMVATNDKS